MSGVVSEEGWWGKPALLTNIVLTTLIATASIYYFRRRRLVNLINKLPGPKGIPILGNALQMHVDNHDDTMVPTGTNIVLMIHKIHRDPAQFPDPEKFDPDRFLPKNVAKRHPYAFIPFSAGPRNCIGQKFAVMEEKVVLGKVLRQFKVESDTPMEDLQLLGEVVLWPRNGNFIRLIPRRP